MGPDTRAAARPSGAPPELRGVGAPHALHVALCPAGDLAHVLPLLRLPQQARVLQACSARGQGSPDVRRVVGSAGRGSHTVCAQPAPHVACMLVPSTHGAPVLAWMAKPASASSGELVLPTRRKRGSILSLGTQRLSCASSWSLAASKAARRVGDRQACRLCRWLCWVRGQPGARGGLCGRRWQARRPMMHENKWGESLTLLVRGPRGARHC